MLWRTEKVKVTVFKTETLNVRVQLITDASFFSESVFVCVFFFFNAKAAEIRWIMPGQWPEQ